VEERALRAELPGYAAYVYMADVKYRLIPYIW
jgi:protein-S-isoprenylcysteine O-methyltransferase Ste14